MASFPTSRFRMPNILPHSTSLFPYDSSIGLGDETPISSRVIERSGLKALSILDRRHNITHGQENPHSPIIPNPQYDLLSIGRLGPSPATGSLQRSQPSYRSNESHHSQRNRESLTESTSGGYSRTLTSDTGMISDYA
jgi:hypothetical protein